jgi:hypothetical protein
MYITEKNTMNGVKDKEKKNRRTSIKIKWCGLKAR